MSDIVATLRAAGSGPPPPDGPSRARLLLLAADEIERLRSQPCPFVTGTVTRYCTLTPFALTDAERAAVAWALKEAVWSYSADTGNHRPTLRGLLERLGGAK